jgi:hypothetical protein
MEFLNKKKTEVSGDAPKKKPEVRIKINCGGVKFETFRSTLERIPGTRLALLANLQEKDENYNSDYAEYFFDRHPGAFASILHYYRTEELHTDQNICGNIIKGVSCPMLMYNISLSRNMYIDTFT